LFTFEGSAAAPLELPSHNQNMDKIAKNFDARCLAQAVVVEWGEPRWVPALLIGALGLAGCSTLETSNDRVNPERPLWFNRPSGAMHLLFLRGLTAESRGVGEPVERGRAEIDVFRGRVFVGSSDHGLYALRANNGSPIWRFETLNVVQSEPLYDAALDVVYFGSNDGALYAVRASDGSLVWRFDSGAEIARRPVLDGEALYFANGSDNLFAIDRRTARRLWQVHRTPALGMEISGYAGPAVDGGFVFIAFSDGHVGAYDARDGNERFPPVDLSAQAEQSQGADALRYLDVDTTPVPDDLGPQGRVIFVASYAGGVYALDEEHGVPVWKNEKAVGVTDLVLWREREHAPAEGSPSYVPGGPPVPARKILLASSSESGLWALDPESGKELWRVPLPQGGITAPVPIAGALLVGTTRYGAFLLSPLNGHPIDGFDLGSGFSQTPAAFGNEGFLLSNAGTLVGVEVNPPVVLEAHRR
jgi:outer membrane protein assembly factor BamB